MKRFKLFPRSIRWRLPLSYAAVALLTALVLGIVLLSALRLYYREREVDYLRRSANYIADNLAQSMSEGLTAETLQEQAAGLAYLTSTRIQLTSAEGTAIADTGIFSLQQLRMLVQERIADATTSSDLPDISEIPEVAFVPPENFGFGEGSLFLSDQQLFPAPESVYIFRPGRPRFGANLENESDLWVSAAVRDEANGELLGYLTVSGGPNYSQGILSGVAVAWGVAGIVAVLLAALVGWLVSRRMSRPLYGLTWVTEKMADGDLSIRADDGREDEFGSLAVSFNGMAERIQTFILTLQRFVADAAHELSTPLTALRNNLDLALEEEDRAKQAVLIKNGRNQVQRLEEMVDGLLDLAHLETGEQSPQQTVNLVQLLLKISDQYASRAEQAGLTLLLNLPSKDGNRLLLSGDEAQLRRALGNLLDNAIKFTPEGGSITAGISAEAQWTNLWVEDNGIGIPEQDLPLLFNRFHRGRNTAVYPGSGLGLAIVQAIAKHHGGDVSAENTGSGACFTIRLPQA